MEAESQPNTAYLYPAHCDDHYALKRHNELGAADANHFVLSDSTVAPFHAHIFVRGSDWVLKDLSTPMGCSINGVRVKEAYLTDLDEIRLGRLSFVFSKSTLDRSRPRSRNLEWDHKLQSLGHFAKSDSAVLILGESGTGKELLANWVHKLSYRSHGPMTTINCSALSESLIESELFGHVRGSFTGATTDRKGAFEVSRGGTLFLDEIGDLPLQLQPKLLRALENKEVRPVGSDKTIACDVRIVAATHKPLQQLVQSGGFRRDLYYRLNVCRIEAPKLIHRLEDFEALFYHFAKEARVRFTAQAIRELKLHAWPGNIRELKNVVFRAKAYFHGQDVTPQHLDSILDPGADLNFDVLPPEKLRQEVPVIKDLERKIIVERLTFHRGNQRKVAADLGMPKSTLNDRIQSYGIQVKNFKPQTAVLQ